MFKLESYIAPLLMSYINKYVKLQQEDFTLSLWGGDVVLSKLDLRLDAIESALNLPITFKSGHIYELRVHVPWTKLGSEPVVITINTIECILRLKESGSEDGAESTSGQSASSLTRTSSGTIKPRIKRQDTEDLPPGYLQSLVNRIVNNVNIVINNLILKFVEDDIVLSVNIKSAECYSVNQDWKRAFVELAMPELVLRRVFDFHDLTVCLDRRNASGKIDAYQDPLLYRCSLTCRIHMIHDSITAKYPNIIRFNLLCEQLDLSLTDTQLPMFCRLLELAVALYYGTLQTPGLTKPNEEGSTSTHDTQDISSGILVAEDPSSDDQQGWASWAWSYVPQILPTGEEEEYDFTVPRRKQEPPVLSIGLYIKRASVVFKLTETVADSATYNGSSRLNFVPCIRWEANGITLDVLIRGLIFFNVQFGVTGTQMVAQGDAICGISDLGSRDPCFMKSGSCVEEKSHPLISFMTGSLFDSGGAENQNERPTYIFEEDKHLQRYTETFSLVKFGSFWMDYLYTMEEREDSGEGQSSNVSQNQTEENVKENSQLRFLFGPLHVIVSSSMVQRLHKLVYCIGCHEYEPYSRPQKEIVDESRPPPTEEQVLGLERYIPTRSYHVTMTKPVIWLLANDLPHYDVKKRKTVSHRKTKKARQKPSPGPYATPVQLPTGVFQAERVDVQVNVAMYPRKLVQLVSKMAAPSSNLLHHCHRHLYLKFFSVQAGLSRRETSGKFTPVQNIIQPWSGAYCKRSLLFPMYWKNSLQPRRECMYELPHLTINLTKPQLLMMIHMVLTWSQPDPNPLHTSSQVPTSGQSVHNIPVSATSLMDDVFRNTEMRTNRKRPVLEVSISGVEVRDCVTPALRAITGTLTATQAMVIHMDGGHDTVTPIMYGPLNTKGVSTHEFFAGSTSVSETTSEDFLTFTSQLPENPNMPAAPAVLRLDVRGVAVTVDPILYEWMSYTPTPLKPAHLGQKSINTLDTPTVNIDASLAESSSPLKSQGSRSESGPTLPTETPTGSREPMSVTKPSTEPMTRPEEHPPDNIDKSEQISQILAQYFPVVKIMEVQVDIRTCCLFLPSRHVRLIEVTMDIPRNLAAVFAAGSLPETLVVCCPVLHLHSAGHKGMPPATVDIPIRTLDQSVLGEKLPWSVELSDFTVYTLQQADQRHYIVRPASMSATVAVTTKYHPPTSDNITALGLCIHADMDAVIMGCSHSQIEQLCDVFTSIVSATTKLVKSIRSQLATVIKSETVVPPTEPVQPTLACSPAKPAANLPTVSTSSQLDPPVTITETSDTTSRETTPIQDIEDTAGVKLSLWIQWTLPKFVFAVHSLDDHGRDLRVVSEIEDVATSVDVQDVYSKVKVKVGMLNVSHEFKEMEGGRWQKGDHEGLLLTGSDKLHQNVVVVSNKTWPTHNQHIPNLFTNNHGETKPRDKNHGFLTVTFTRALRKNVKKRMKKMALEGFPVEEAMLPSGKAALVYLNELCINLQPCDLVVNCPILSQVIKVFTWHCPPPSSDVPMSERAKEDTQKNVSEASTNTAIPVLTPAFLPLIYINTSNFRMLFPTGALSDNKKSDSDEQKHDYPSRTHHDVWIAHLRALTLTPVADNPLPRIVLEKEVYRRAMQAGITQQPGSEVEDRQYQLDVAALSLSTGRWEDLVVDEKTKEDDSPIVQHPALEWNNLKRQREEKEEVWLIPVATPFDLRVVAAPAVVYSPIVPGRLFQPLLVCGHSLELNATSDIDFYLSNLQVKLALDVFSTNVAALLGTAAVRKVDSSSGKWNARTEEWQEEGTQIDSGVDSETSTFVAGQQRISTVITKLPEPEVTLEESTSDLSNLVPFDVLLTAGKISFMTYMHKLRPAPPQDRSTQKVVKPGIDVAKILHQKKGSLEIKVPPIPGLELCNSNFYVPAALDTVPHLNASVDIEDESTITTADSGIGLDSLHKSTEGSFKEATKQSVGDCTEEVPYIVPFSYMTFAQPHTMLKVERTGQKLELSCYDVILKGAQPGHSFREEIRLIPDIVDYDIHWVETKAGEANAKTGIPPSLYTIQITDFLLGPAVVLLKLERPLKVNGSITCVRQVITYVQDLMPYFTDLLPSNVEPKDSQIDGADTSEPQVCPPTLLAVLAHLQSIHIQTVQVVLYLETQPHPQTPTIQLSITDVDTDVKITTSQTGGIQAVNFNWNVTNFLLKTGYGGTLRPLLGPMSLVLSFNADWTVRHSGPVHLPRVLCCLDTGLVPVSVGQEHILCIQLVMDHISHLLQTFQTSSVTTDEVRKRKPSKGTTRSHKTYRDFELQASVDDLRAGDFEYNTIDSSPDMLPRPNEIMFSMDYEEGHATMTWCYAEPRVVTFLHVTPVPFNLPHQSLDTRFIDEGLKVPCILQYWNVLCHDFEDYTSFDISQSEATSVALQEVTSQTDPNIVAAQIWRALILHPQDREQSGQTETDEHIEPIVSPMTLAASLRVDSCFSASLVPVLQIAASASSIQLRPCIHYRHLSKDVHNQLHPYSLDSSFFTHDHEFAVITIENPTMTLSHVTGISPLVSVDVNASFQCDVIEYRNLTMRPLLESVDVTCGATWQIHTEQTLFRLRGELSPLYVRVGEGAIHTLTAASQAYAQLSHHAPTCVLPHYYLVCNNTCEMVRFGQVGTDEDVSIASHQMIPYGWRSHKIQQLIQLTVEGFGGLWSDPIDIDKDGTVLCILENKGQTITVFVKVKTLSGIQKQVEICGSLLIGSRLTQHLEVKVVSSKNKEDKSPDSSAVLGSEGSLPSYIIDPKKVCAIRVKLFGLKTTWSQEIVVTGEKAKDSRLVKVPLADKGNFVHVWCHVFTEDHQSAVQHIVLFVPLFTVRSHFPTPLLMNVETPRLRSSRQQELKGQGYEEHLFMVGGDMTHNITFLLSAGQQPSSPPIALSSGMIEQVPREVIECIGADQLLTGWKKDISEAWPYNDVENVSSTEPIRSPLGSTYENRSPPQEVAMAVPPSEDSANQPNIDLQISLKQRWPSCNTLLIDITPYWMMVNETNLDLVVIENNEQQWRLSGKQTFAPPVFNSPFRLGLIANNQLHTSDSVTLSDEEMTFRYLHGQEDILYNQGHLKITIPVGSNQEASQVCFITLHSVMSHGMRVVTVRETYIFINQTAHDLNIQPFCLPLSEHKVTLDHDSVESLHCKTWKKSDAVIPIPIWHQPLPSTTDQDKHDVRSDIHHVQYISLQKCAGQEDYESASLCWALPCRIRVADHGTRLSLALPSEGSTFVTMPCVLTVHQRAGIVYMMIAEEPDPGMEIHNHCNFTIAYGQGLIGVQAEDKTIQEEAELTSDFLSIPPGGSAFYTFPAFNIHYPQVSALPEKPKFHLAGYADQSHGNQKLMWSLGLDLETEHDIFVNIPGISDAKVHTEKVGHTLHVFIDPVSRAEISAKEIRSRIKGKEKTVVVGSKKQKIPEKAQEQETATVVQDCLTEAKKQEKRKPLRPVLTEAVVVCTYASFILLDEGSNPKVASELLRLSADRIAGAYFPVDLYDPFQQMRPHLAYSAAVTCEDLQVDNQMYVAQTYDFPVVFKRQIEKTKTEFHEAFYQLTPKEQLSKLKKTSLITFEMSLCTDLTSKVSSLTGVDLNLQPVTVFIEDTFVYNIIHRLNRLMNASLSQTSQRADIGIVIPREVTYVCCNLSCPVRLKQVVIEPVSILLSVHASLKLFIASDNTPLSFSKFEQKDLFTNAPQLLRAAAMHYASGTLYRAGWVVGSLEILGNPTGLVRNVGMGISDMFRMPYQGLMQGPGAFVGGVTRGMGSLVRHISTGALTSVTNFASSVSRNMERMSLDSVHRARQEEGRRHKPRGVSDGLVNGLSGFGISLLGAVAGIADQPLQTLMRSGDQAHPISTTNQATGIVSGVGKGLVGAITKPIGGAAELVSQTGLGLLQGTGLKRFPTPRQSPIAEPAAAAPSSTLKVMEKLLLTVPNAEVLAVVDALSVDSRTAPLQQQQVSLLLTPEILFIINMVDDTPLQAYAITEISCQSSLEDPSMLAVVVTSKTSPASPTTGEAWAGQLHEGVLPEDQMNNKDRIAAFLGTATNFTEIRQEDQSESTSPGVHSHAPSFGVQHEFHVDAQNRLLFMALFSAAKRKSTGTGFPV